jgi:hypothetical protein
VVQTADGQYRLVGEQRRTNSPTLVFVADVDERAQFVEIQRFGYLADARVGGAVPVGETDTLVAGTLGGSRGLVVRVTPDGEKRWETVLDDADTRITAVDGGVRGPEGSPDAGVVVAGSRTTDGDDRPWAARVGSDGALAWESTYGPSASNTATGVALGDGGRFVLGGPTIVNSAWFVGGDPTVSGTPTPTTTPTPTPTGTTPPPGGSGGDFPLGLVGGAALVGGAIALAGAAVLRRLGGGDGGADGGSDAEVAVDPGDELAGGVSAADTATGSAAGDDPAGGVESDAGDPDDTGEGESDAGSAATDAGDADAGPTDTDGTDGEGADADDTGSGDGDAGGNGADAESGDEDR